MRLAERLKRTIFAPSAPAVGDSPIPAPARANDRKLRIAELRREMTRLAGRTVLEPPRRVRPTIPTPPTRPRATVRHAADPSGLLYQQTFELNTCFGQEPLSTLLPSLPAVQKLLEYVALWAPDASPLQLEDLLLLDIETTGLSRAAGTLAIVVGVGYFASDQGPLQVDQLFLREPSLEPQLLERLGGYLQRARVLITFNGGSFDLPILRNRALLNRRGLPELSRSHLDLLPLSRRVWRGRLDNCRLSTLERQVLGFYRTDDIDGAEIPAVYFDFLRTGRTDEIDHVLSHNQLDVAVMASVLNQVSRHLLAPLHWAEDGEELLSTGLFHLQHGQADLGEACLVRGLELARLPCTRQRLTVALASHLRRGGRSAEAVTLWEAYRREFPQSNRGWVELAKYHEHVTKDLLRALDLAENAPGQEQTEHAQRVERLRRRLARHINKEGGDGQRNVNM
jgi:uncharacterized protein